MTRSQAIQTLYRIINVEQTKNATNQVKYAKILDRIEEELEPYLGKHIIKQDLQEAKDFVKNEAKKWLDDRRKGRIVITKEEAKTWLENRRQQLKLASLEDLEHYADTTTNFELASEIRTYIIAYVSEEK